MDQRKISVETATTEELRQFASATLGMDLPRNMRHENVLARVKAAWNQPEITLAIEAPRDAVDTRPSVAAAGIDESQLIDHLSNSSRNDYLIDLYIPSVEEPGGTEAVPTAVNGNTFFIPRDKQVPVPYRFYLALNDAVRYRFEMNGDEIDPVPRKVHQYPFSVRSVPYKPSKAA